MEKENLEQEKCEEKRNRKKGSGSPNCQTVSDPNKFLNESNIKKHESNIKKGEERLI